MPIDPGSLPSSQAISFRTSGSQEGSEPEEMVLVNAEFHAVYRCPTSGMKEKGATKRRGVVFGSGFVEDGQMAGIRSLDRKVTFVNQKLLR